MFAFISRLFDGLRTAMLHADHGDDVEPDAPIAIDADGWATGEGVHRIPSPRSQRLVSRDESGPAPVGIVSHWTSTGEGTGWACARRIAKPVGAGERSASWHVLITRTGEILQSVSFRRGSWHAGGASAARFDATGKKVDGGRLSANSLFVGVELENVGSVRQVDGVWMGWPFGRNGRRGPIVPAAQVVAADGRHYQAYTSEQEVAARRLWRTLVAEYPITMASAAWGHVDIDPTRKSDPGPLWSAGVLPRILQAVF